MFNGPVTPPPCSQCTAACCRQTTGWKHACWLGEEDLKDLVIKAKARWLREEKAWVLPYKSGKCVFLDDATSRCKIYEQRPTVCRTFNCRECNEFNQFIALNPVLKQLLKESK